MVDEQRDPSSAQSSPDLLNELVLGKRGFQSLDLVSLVGEYVSARLVDILEQQNLDVLGVEGLESLCGAPLGQRCAKAVAGRRGVKGGRGRGRQAAVRDLSRQRRPDVLRCGHFGVVVVVVKVATLLRRQGRPNEMARSIKVMVVALIDLAGFHRSFGRLPKVSSDGH